MLCKKIEFGLRFVQVSLFQWMWLRRAKVRTVDPSGVCPLWSNGRIDRSQTKPLEEGDGGTANRFGVWTTRKQLQMGRRVRPKSLYGLFSWSIRIIIHSIIERTFSLVCNERRKRYTYWYCCRVIGRSHFCESAKLRFCFESCEQHKVSLVVFRVCEPLFTADVC